jgi:1-acyl-sn-glycerol-3-phosphate acyltransferase
MMPERWKPWWYELLYYPAAALFFGLLSLRVKGRRHVPQSGGLLVLANHQSYFDPPLIGVAVRRRLSYVAKKSLFGSRFFGWFINSLGALPINAEASGTEGIKAALSLLKAGKAVLVFPEGGRTDNGVIQPLKPGIIVLIRRAGVPVLPVGVAGVYEAWPMHRKLPRLAPIFWPAGSGTAAAVVGQPIAAEKLSRLPPDQMLADLHQVLVQLRAEAEHLRRREDRKEIRNVDWENPRSSPRAQAGSRSPGNPAA